MGIRSANRELTVKPPSPSVLLPHFNEGGSILLDAERATSRGEREGRAKNSINVVGISDFDLVLASFCNYIQKTEKFVCHLLTTFLQQAGVASWALLRGALSV